MEEHLVQFRNKLAVYRIVALQNVNSAMGGNKAPAAESASIFRIHHAFLGLARVLGASVVLMFALCMYLLSHLLAMAKSKVK